MRIENLMQKAGDYLHATELQFEKAVEELWPASITVLVAAYLERTVQAGITPPIAGGLLLGVLGTAYLAQKLNYKIGILDKLPSEHKIALSLAPTAIAVGTVAKVGVLQMAGALGLGAIGGMGYLVKKGLSCMEAAHLPLSLFKCSWKHERGPNLFDAVHMNANDLGLVKFLKEHGADVNIKDRADLTPLHYAALLGYENIVDYLLQAGAQINERDITGRTPLHHAVNGAHQSVVKELILHGAEINVIDTNGETPMHYAARVGDQSIIKELMWHGADIKKKNIMSRTPKSMLKVTGLYPPIKKWRDAVMKAHG